jgi:DNA processing protein
MVDPVKSALGVMTLSLVPGIGRKALARILDQVSSLPEDPSELRLLAVNALSGSSRYECPSEEEFSVFYQNAQKILSETLSKDIRVLTTFDPQFPILLKGISDPPVILYVKGNTTILNKWCVAVVGRRKPTEYGLDMAKRIGGFLAREGIVVVSGLAVGCDTAGHQGCLENNGETVAVLAHGLDMVYPAQNLHLAEEILDMGGCLISEYPVGTKPLAGFFVERDRLQSGLSSGVIVIEAEAEDGTMHTARFAVEQGRLLGCLKPPTGGADMQQKVATGNELLLSEGNAIPLTNASDLENMVAMLRQRWDHLIKKGGEASNWLAQNRLIE